MSEFEEKFTSSLKKIAVGMTLGVAGSIAMGTKMFAARDQIKNYEEKNLKALDSATSEFFSEGGTETDYDSAIQSSVSQIENMSLVSRQVKDAKIKHLNGTAQNNKILKAKSAVIQSSERATSRSESIITNDPSTYEDQLINHMEYKDSLTKVYNPEKGSRIHGKQQDALLNRAVRTLLSEGFIDEAKDKIVAADQHGIGTLEGRDSARILINQLEKPIRKLQANEKTAIEANEAINRGEALPYSATQSRDIADILNEKEVGLTGGKADRKNIWATKIDFTSGYQAELSNGMRNYNAPENMVIAADSTLFIYAAGTKVPDGLLIQALGVKDGIQQRLPFEKIVERSVNASEKPLPSNDINTKLIPPLMAFESDLRNSIAHKSNPELYNGIFQSIDTYFLAPKIDQLSPAHRKMYTDTVKMSIHAYQMNESSAMNAAASVLANNISLSSFSPKPGEWNENSVERNNAYKNIADGKEKIDIISHQIMEDIVKYSIGELKDIKESDADISLFGLKLKDQKIFLQRDPKRGDTYFIGVKNKYKYRYLLDKNYELVRFIPRPHDPLSRIKKDKKLGLKAVPIRDIM